ncbi:hypothetical protein QYE76_016742 [Lolium multiflorum]|uniref:TF-B3 domain-containing protein n=1 Tax=Lolium multiflorum TaxID=4521 RepID=A0AAD8QJR0_LOLMU|nr:hypothetical protein QYE76_016742 [Lolium multiflorum]
MYLHTGWDKFARDLVLEPGCQLTFLNKGDREMIIKVFDDTACRMHYHTVACTVKQEPSPARTQPPPPPPVAPPGKARVAWRWRRSSSCCVGRRRPGPSSMLAAEVGDGGDLICDADLVRADPLLEQRHVGGG